jgi:RNA polymerase sigma factor (sigma-70 family)
MELLRTYTETANESAFTQLIQRHVGWMFQTARHRLRDDSLADDAVQVAFVILSSKAAPLSRTRRRSISAWLFHVLHFACARIRRSRSRQFQHEHNAASMRDSEHRPETQTDDATLMLLEDTIAKLPARDREALVHRFYQNEKFPAVGQALGISPDAARKRVDRALLALKQLMICDGVNILPDDLIKRIELDSPAAPRIPGPFTNNKRLDSLAKGAMTMAQQSRISEFTTVSAEFYVKDVEANLAFFEKLGFTPRWKETPDPLGRLSRASLAAGAARIWLRRSSETENTRPTPGVKMFFWINGGPDALIAHRNTITAEGIQVSPFSDDHTLRNFTVTTPDGYTIGFFTNYRE